LFNEVQREHYITKQLCLHLSLPPPCVRAYCTQQQSPKDEPNKITSFKERTASALTYAGDLGRQWGRNTVKAATVTVNYWWERYEEFVGLNE
ncbi:hypothetical protein M9458_045128, partial [Cirrhinus mrigala]